MAEAVLTELTKIHAKMGSLISYLSEEKDQAPIKKKSKWVVYVDAGHGGNHPQTGAYMTNPRDGKHYTFLPENINIREGVVNRKIANTFCKMLEQSGIECVKTYHPYLDSSHSDRVGIANRHFAQVRKEGRRAVFLSFHSNATGMSAQGASQPARGVSFWTTRGTTEADRIATLWYEHHQKLHGNSIRYLTDMSDGDIDFEANFDVLFWTHMPAVLIENLFFTNIDDARLLLSGQYQVSSARAAHNMVMELEKLA